MCRYGKVPGPGSIQHESMVLQLKGGIVRICDLGSTGVMIGLQTCFLLWVMRMAWSPKTEGIESTEAGKVSKFGQKRSVQDAQDAQDEDGQTNRI